MKIWPFIAPVLAASLTTLATVTPGAARAQRPADYAVKFLGRTIDLRPHLQGFPYLGWNADFDAGRLFYFHETAAGRFLIAQPLGGRGRTARIDPAAGRRVHDVDWSKRNFLSMRFDSVGGDMLVHADERNDEVGNLYRLSLRTGALTKLTDVPYIYGWDISPDGRRVGYVARYGAREPYRSCLRVLELQTGASRDVVCGQGGEQRMVWSAVNWRPDGRGVVLRVNRRGERKQGNLAYVDLTRPAPTLDLLLPVGTERFALGTDADEAWLDADRFYYTSDESGFANRYVFDLERRTSTQVTRVAEENWSTPIVVDGRRLLLVNHTRPHENEMLVLDPATGAELGRRTFDASVRVVGFDRRNHFVVALSSAAFPFRADDMWVRLRGERAEWVLEPKVRQPAALARAVEQCNVERVSFPTFDTDPRTGSARTLHAFLLTPKRPRPNPAERLAVITAFYGGANAFDTRAQIFCEAGVAWLSPAVRGSAGFGKAFGALNDRDLGGDEIVDLFYAARFLERRLGLAPRQIGVAGGSHGGFATMRALTFPPATNGRGEQYALGFGMSHAGFSSIVTFNQATNIPDWIVLEAGDPVTERDKLLDRSPVSHVNLLRAPLLLTHGSNDNRVGVSESRQFNAAARRLNKPVTYVEFAGQGHGIKGLANEARWYRAQFDFLEAAVVGAERAAPATVVP